jgi:hypothetical protein
VCGLPVNDVRGAAWTCVDGRGQFAAQGLRDPRTLCGLVRVLALDVLLQEDMHAPTIEPRTAGYIIAGILAACAGAELGRVFADVPWGAFTPLASHGVALVLSTLWIVTAFSLALRDRFESLDDVAWMTVFPAVTLLLFHGFVATWGAGGQSAASRAALLYPVLAVACTALLRKTFARDHVTVPAPQPIPWRLQPALRLAHQR